MNPVKELKLRWKQYKHETDSKIDLKIIPKREKCKAKHQVQKCRDCSEYSRFCLIRER